MSGFFQSLSYFDLIRGVPGLKPFVHNLNNEEKNNADLLIGVIKQKPGKLFQLLSSRILILEEPCIDGFIDWYDNYFVANKSAGGNLAIYTEIRLLEPLQNPTISTALPYTEKLSYLNILVDTTLPEEYLYSCLSGSKKRQVQSSLAAGAIVRPAHSEKEVHDFYAILSDLYRNKIRKPLMPEEVFLRIFRNKNSGVVLIASHDGCIAGGMLCPFSSDGVMYEWYIAGQDRKKKSSKIYPSVLLTWEAIRYAAVNGFRQFNFMGAGESGKPYGTRDFKLQFGGKLVEAPRYLFIHKPFLYRLGKMALQLGLGS